MMASAQNNELQPNTVLIVDDDEFSRELLGEIISDEYNCLYADNGLEGLKIFEENRPLICAVFLDLMMPVMNGESMLKEMASRYGEIPSPIFIITGTTSTNEQEREAQADTAKKCCEIGAVEVIPKGESEGFMVKRRIKYMIELFNSRNNFEKAVKAKTAELREQNQGMIVALATATEFRSSESGEHVHRIFSITRLFLDETRFGEQYTQEQIEQIATASILHDVGKISISDAILNKPGRLTKEEFEIMKQHTVNGGKMLDQIPQLKKLPFYEYAKTIAMSHHERWDGRGYPHGLKGDEIPVEAQVVSIADVYDALVNTRVYKPPFSHEQAVKMITAGECGSFNPELLQEFVRIADKIQELYKDNDAHAHIGEYNG